MQPEQAKPTSKQSQVIGPRLVYCYIHLRLLGSWEVYTVILYIMLKMIRSSTAMMQISALLMCTLLALQQVPRGALSFSLVATPATAATRSSSSSSWRLLPLKVRVCEHRSSGRRGSVCLPSFRTRKLVLPAHDGLLSLARYCICCCQAAESEVSFDDDLDGSKMRIGIIRTRWNDEHVSNLVAGVRDGLKQCKVDMDQAVFETSVPGCFELPMAARFLALSGTVDAIVCCGVLIKGETMHFEYIADAVAKGLMNTGLQTSTPIVFGVLTCMDEDQVKARSSGSSNHGVDWGKTAVEMALLRTDAMGGKSEKKAKLESMGFALDAEKEAQAEKKKPAFF